MKKSNGKLLAALAGAVAGAVAGGAAIGTTLNKETSAQNENLKKMISFYHVLNQWLTVRQEGKSLAEYFKRNNYKTVAIYGMKELGERLYDELKDSGVTVKYIIDKNASAIYANEDVVTPDEDLEPVDVIVVTAIYYFNEIEEMLLEKVDYPIVSLEDIVYEV